ncbi:MAG: ketoacyl-ACP synthase III [Lentimicrobiaceae bacterium]|nr:ketoacyl-ACP synthase III [Lentimicrobiaceae bacterium]
MKIIGTGRSHPSLVVTNDMLSQFLDTSDEWITSRTGIKERRIISSENLEDLAIDAAKKALADANIEAKDLDYIICANVVNEYISPAMSCIILGALGANCPCFDLNGACVGFIYALEIAEAFYRSGKYKNILVVCAEEPSRMVDWHDRSASVLFGDGAAAVVLTEGDNIKATKMSASCNWDRLYQKHELQYSPFNTKPNSNLPLVMHGQDVFKFATRAAIRDINAVLKQSGYKADDVKHFLIHQANLRIINSIKEYLRQADEKFPLNIHRYGNTSSASVPILLDEVNKEGRLKRGDLIVMSAFGAGFVSGACILEW